MKDENRKYVEYVAKVIETYASGIVKEEGEIKSLYDWIDEEALDFEFVVNRDKRLLSAKIFVTLGGPTVWIDTAAKAVKLAWGGNYAEYPIAEDAAEQLNDIMVDIYINI